MPTKPLDQANLAADLPISDDTQTALTALGAALNAKADDSDLTTKADTSTVTALASRVATLENAPLPGTAQPLDMDLTAIAALDSGIVGVLVSDGGTVGWTRKSFAALKSALGLNNVNNTADADKPVSNAVQAALTVINNRLTALEGGATPDTIPPSVPTGLSITFYPNA